MSAPLTKNRVRTAGRRLRKHFEVPNQPSGLDQEELLREFAVLVTWRASFREPLDRVVSRLEEIALQTASELTTRSPIVGRLKREPQIVSKLIRFRNIPLPEMQDIGGCRIVLPGGQSQVDDLRARIEANQHFQIAGSKTRDYATKPKGDGYRALHLVTKEMDRLIEIQIRTPAQHAFASFVEKADLDFGLEIKNGNASASVVEFLQLYSHVLTSEERNEPVSAETKAELERLYTRFIAQAKRRAKILEVFRRQG